MAKFDPKEFAGFDPEAFAAGGEDVELEEGGPESFLSPETFKPSKGQRKFKNQTGPISQVRRDLDPKQIWNPPDIGEAVAAPVLSAVDRLTLGALGAGLRGAKAINEATGETDPTVASRSLEAIEGYRRSHPTMSMYSDIPGYMVGGPRAIAASVERMLPAASTPVFQAARATVGSGVSSGLVSGAESVSRGDEPEEVLREVGRGYVGGTAVGAPLSAGAALFKGAANAVLGSKGAKAREYLESRGQPLTASDTSDAAIGAAAQRADEAVKSRLQSYKGEVATGPYMEAIEAVPERLANQPVDVTPIYRNLALAAKDPANLQVADKLNMLVNMLGDRPIMTQRDLNGLRQSLAHMSGAGESTAPKLSPLKRAYEQTKALVDRGPYAEANRRFNVGMDDFRESLDMVGLKATRRVDDPITGNLRVVSQRQGQNAVTAGADTERLDLEAFKAKHPDLAQAVDAAEVIRKQGDIGFHMQPHHGGLIERTVGVVSPGAALALAAMGHGAKGAAIFAAMMAIQNRQALAGRVLYTPAQEAQIAAQMLLQGAPAIAAPGREVVPNER